MQNNKTTAKDKHNKLSDNKGRLYRVGQKTGPV